MPEAVIELQGVGKRYGRGDKAVDALNGLTLAVPRGSLYGLLGPNGAGKTTTLKMLTGLIHPSGGQLRVAGHEPWRRQARFLRQITLVMGQKQQLLWDLPRLWQEVVAGLREAGTRHGRAVASVGVDTWGVDFGFLGGDGRMLANPVCYRDPRTRGMIASAERNVPRADRKSTRLNSSHRT